MIDGVLMSRNLKPIPNAFVQEKLKDMPDGLDGELIVGSPTGDDVWNRTQSGVMSEDGEPDFMFYAFDDFSLISWTFTARLSDLKERENNHLFTDRIHVLHHELCANMVEVMNMETRFVNAGYEGAMIRTLDGRYKHGRSGALGGKTGWLFKLKRWHDMEARVVDVVEQMHNTNEAEKDELGRTKRSSAKAGKVPKGTLGALVCEAADGSRFEIGTGLNDSQRKALWENPPIGQLARVKYQSLTTSGVPRFPVFEGLRDLRDA
jgi:DNA ligase-1